MGENGIRNMEDFAAASGLSRPTVSKYFNDPESVRPTTRRRIEEALERYDYRPNIFAMNQNRKLTKNIGVVVPYLSDPFFAEIARKIERRCIDAGFRPTLFSAHGDPQLEREILENLRSLKPAGLLIAPLGLDSDRGAIEAFCTDTPTILFDSKIDGVDAPFVGSDNPQFMRLIVDYLCRTGSPPCYFEMETPPNPNADKRRAAYVEAMARRGHQPMIVPIRGEGWDFEEIGRVGGADALAGGRLPSNTVLCNNDRLAIGLLAACYERKVRVGAGPDAELRIAGQDDHPYARFTCPSLTTVAHDYDAISRQAATMLLEMMAGGREATGAQDLLFEGKLIQRFSA